MKLTVLKQDPVVRMRNMVDERIQSFVNGSSRSSSITSSTVTTTTTTTTATATIVGSAQPHPKDMACHETKRGIRPSTTRTKQRNMHMIRFNRNQSLEEQIFYLNKIPFEIIAHQQSPAGPLPRAACSTHSPSVSLFAACASARRAQVVVSDENVN
jgi:hypothetical protein